MLGPPLDLGSMKYEDIMKFNHSVNSKFTSPINMIDYSKASHIVERIRTSIQTDRKNHPQSQQQQQQQQQTSVLSPPRLGDVREMYLSNLTHQIVRKGLQTRNLVLRADSMELQPFSEKL